MISRFAQKDLDKEFDLIVIGGGINGCGIAFDASSRGLKVLLLEKDDFASGCTSASTRLIHGGLRYLEYFEFNLVRESLIEREILLQNAKHLIKPIELCIPVYRNDKRGYWLIKAGMFLYDFLSTGKSMPSHKSLSPAEFGIYEPSLKHDDLIAAVIYHDAYAQFPERICIENILMAGKCGALLLNHAEVIKIDIESYKISSVEFIDHLTSKSFTAKAKIIINASGPWVDDVCRLTNQVIKNKVGGTKGSHIVIKKFKNGLSHAIYVQAKSDGRPFFIIPWQDYYLIGTTDIIYYGDLNYVKASEEELKYLIDESNNIFTSYKITSKDILFTYSGVRPLPCVSNTDPSGITRRYIVIDHISDGIENYLSILGGKLTTYRSLSEEVVNRVLKKIGGGFVKSITKTNKFIGNIDESIEIDDFKKSQYKKLNKKYELESEIFDHLIDLYGKKYKDVLKYVSSDKDLAKLLSSNSFDIRAQINYSVEHEFAWTVKDVIRRMSLGLVCGLGRDAIPQIAKQLQSLLGYSSHEIDKQIVDYENNYVKLRTL